eukprot:Lithocolla_globosa_v1_NODE_1030_length_2930_cov_412.241391.p2 type:complete len:127 gc:universal NODE_1030_length_2930_cov_412.241391:787-407(-)
MMNAVNIRYGVDALDDFVLALKQISIEAQTKHDSWIKWTLSRDNIRRSTARDNDREKIDDRYNKAYQSRKSSSLHSFQQRFIAYNSGRYDHYLLLKSSAVTMGLDSMVNSNGILAMTIFDYITSSF